MLLNLNTISFMILIPFIEISLQVIIHIFHLTKMLFCAIELFTLSFCLKHNLPIANLSVENIDSTQAVAVAL